MRAAIVPGGAVVFDESGQLSFGLSDESLNELVGDAPDFLRVAVAHLAAERAVEAGLVEAGLVEPGGETVEDAEEAARPGPPSSPTGAPQIDSPVQVFRSRVFLGAYLLSACLRARKDGSTALPIVEWGSRSYIGPLLAPDASPCIMCLRRAVSPNRQSEHLLKPETDAMRGPGLSGARALRLMLEGSSSPLDEILEVDGDGLLLARHHVRPNPRCRICGDETLDPNDACPVLESRPARAAADTGSRTADPRETYEAYRHLISPVSGAVRRIRRVETSAPELIHVFTASHAMSEDSRSFAAFMRDGRDHSGGKGGSADQARVSALCEALERFSAVSTGGEVDVVAPLSHVKGAIHPAECLLFSDDQYARRDEWNRSASRFQYVPEPFATGDQVAWSRVWCLQTREPAYLPTSLLYLDFDGPGSASCTADSNGLAAGRTLEEAVLQAFFEVVERDAIAIWWYNRIGMPGVGVETFADPYVEAVLEHYVTLGRRAWVLDLTTELGIPVFAALSAREGERLPEVIFGFGAHLDPAVALRRCVTEMSQMLATVSQPRKQRRTQLRGAYDEALHWWDEATLVDNPYLVPDLQLQRRGRECFGSASSDDLKDDIDACLAVATRHELRVYVRDMTRADLNISVAKVVVPGLRHFWRRLAPGRLYDAPVMIGRVEAPLAEEDMNPTSLFV